MLACGGIQCVEESRSNGANPDIRCDWGFCQSKKNRIVVSDEELGARNCPN